MDDFKKYIKDSENVIAIDFDGVIHNDYLGFHDGTIYGEPIEGALESIRELSNNFKIKIFSCKSNPDRPLVDGKTGTELIDDWLVKYGIRDCISDIVWGKPNAMYYIDDKGIRFTNWSDVNQQIVWKK